MLRPITAMDRIAARYIPAGYTEQKRIEPDGSYLDGVVYWKSQFNEITNNTRYYVMSYRGTSSHHEGNYVFVNESDMNRYIDSFFENIRAHKIDKEKTAEARKNFVVKIKVGDILDTSWGYDQTNVEFFQVVSISGKSAVVREISQQQVNASGPFSAQVTALKDHFLKDSKEKRYRILSPGDCMKIEGHWASIWSGEPVHSSWGA